MKLKNKETGEIVYPSNDNEIVIHFEDANECQDFYNKPVKCLDTGEVFASASEAARRKGCSQSNITSVVLGKRSKAGGLRWAYNFGGEK